MSQEAAVSYGFRGFSTDTFDFFFHRYKGFGAAATFGYEPTQGDYRAFFGLAVPQGTIKMRKMVKPVLNFNLCISKILTLPQVKGYTHGIWVIPKQLKLQSLKTSMSRSLMLGAGF